MYQIYVAVKVFCVIVLLSEKIVFVLTKPLLYVSDVVYVVCMLLVSGTAVAQWLRCCATIRKVAGVIEFFIDIKSFRSHYGPGGRLSL